MTKHSKLRVLRPIRSLTVSTAYLVDADGEVVVVDTGLPGVAPQILRGLAKLGREPADLAAILLTHAHPDHVGSAAQLAAATGARVFASALDAPFVELGITGRPLTSKLDIFSRLLFHQFVSRGPKMVPPCKVEARFNGGETLEMAGGVEVVPLPGHTIGHVGYRFATSGDFFVGDALMNLLGPRRSRWHDIERPELESLHTISALPWTRLHVGHGPTINRAAYLRMMRARPPRSTPTQSDIAR
jgi:glyoxylase-like metal-dependent hydrolase (beta-lactamase superfamily II)